MDDVSIIVLKDANGNIIGSYNVKDASVPHNSREAASGGTALSLVTVGEKYTWNAKADTNTTYTLGTNGNKVKLTPSSGTAQEITVPYATSAGSASSVTTAGGDVTLGTSGSSSNNSGDVIWKYGNGQEKARIWTDDTYTSAKGLNYRLYKSDGTQLANGTIPLSDTNNAVTQTNTASTNASYRVLLSGTNDDTDRTEGARKNGDLYYNPSTKNLHSTKFNGYTLGAACAYSATTSVTSGSGALVTSGAVYTGLSGKQNTLSTTDVSSSLSVSGNLQSVTKKLFKYGNVVELFITGNVKTAIADNGVFFTVPTGYNPKVNDVGFTFFTGTDQYIPTGFKFGYFTWGGRDFHTLGALGVGTQVTVHITYLI